MRKMVLTLFLYSSFFITHYSFSQSGWFSINTGTTRYFGDIYFVNVNTGWAVSDSAKIFKTTNGGLNWSSNVVYNDSKLIFNFVRFADTFTGYAGGQIYDFSAYYHYKRLFFKTTNQGQDWILLESVPSDYGTYYSSVSLVNRDTLFLSTFSQADMGPSYGDIRKSHNGGYNYVSNTSSSFGGYKSLSFINYFTGWASAYCANDVNPHYWDYIYKTTNSGINWILQYIDSVNSGSINKIQFINQNTGFGICGPGVSSDKAKFFKTTNSGLNWSCNLTPFLSTYRSLYFVNETTGWICGYWASIDSTTIARTTDGGQTFHRQRKNLEYITSIYFLNSMTGYAVGYNGLILKTTNGGVTAVNPVSQKIPGSYRLFQNYPNPFNPTAIIKFKIPALSSPHALSGVHL